MPARARLQPCQLTGRDQAILRDLARVRLLSGQQLERLHFAALATPNARGSARRRTLRRLVSAGWVTTLPRRVGGERAGSAGLLYSLDALAQRERQAWVDDPLANLSSGRTRRPWAIGWLFVQHTLDVAELYVQLREAERRGELTLLRFDAEPASWFTLEGTVTLKPDAFVVLETADWERHWWIEVDRATESLPTVQRKLDRYVHLYRSGRSGPDGLWPRVLVTVPDERRGDHLRALAQLLGTEAGFIEVARFDQASRSLPGQTARPPP